MMNFRYMLVKAEKFVTDNSPLILTTIGVAGTISTAVLSTKATFRAAEILNKNYEVDYNSGKFRDSVTLQEPSTREKAELIWKLYIPAVGTGVMTVTCIVMANQIGMRRAAAMAAAYSVSEKAFDEYREKIVEKLGVGKEQKARDEIVQDRVTAGPPKESTIIVTGNGGVLCYDKHTGRYFYSDMESLKKAQNDLNYVLLNEGYASLNDLYDKMNLDRVGYGDELGWNSDKLLELTFSTVMSDDDRPCIGIDFTVTPVRNYFRTH